LTKGDRLEAMPPERAYELLAIRRDAAPAPAKKAAARKTAAKKAARKAAR
jgi:topoisomerase IA-like protein